MARGPKPPKKKELNLRWRRFGFERFPETYALVSFLLTTLMMLFFLIKVLADPPLVLVRSIDISEPQPQRSRVGETADLGLLIAFIVLGSGAALMNFFLICAPGALMNTPLRNKVMSMVGLMFLMWSAVYASSSFALRRLAVPINAAFPMTAHIDTDVATGNPVLALHYLDPRLPFVMAGVSPTAAVSGANGTVATNLGKYMLRIYHSHAENLWDLPPVANVEYSDTSVEQMRDLVFDTENSRVLWDLPASWRPESGKAYVAVLMPARHVTTASAPDVLPDEKRFHRDTASLNLLGVTFDDFHLDLRLFAKL